MIRFIAHRTTETSLDTSEDYTVVVEALRLPALGETVVGLFGDEALTVERIEWRGPNYQDYPTNKVLSIVPHLFFPPEKYVPKTYKINLTYKNSNTYIETTINHSEQYLRTILVVGKVLPIVKEFPGLTLHDLVIHSFSYDSVNNTCKVELRDLEDLID